MVAGGRGVGQGRERGGKGKGREWGRRRRASGGKEKGNGEEGALSFSHLSSLLSNKGRWG